MFLNLTIPPIPTYMTSSQQKYPSQAPSTCNDRLCKARLSGVKGGVFAKSLMVIGMSEGNTPWRQGVMGKVGSHFFGPRQIFAFFPDVSSFQGFLAIYMCV